MSPFTIGCNYHIGNVGEKMSKLSDQEEGTPEEEVGDGHDEEHLHPGHPLPVDPLQVVLHLTQIFQ